MVDRRHLLVTGSVGFAALLSGCVTGRGRASVPVETIPFEALLRQVKYDVGTWLWRHQYEKEALNRPAPGASPEKIKAFNDLLAAGQYRETKPGRKEACAGQVSMTLTKVKLTVTASVDNKTGASGGLEIPIGLASFSPSGSYSVKDSQSLTTTVEIYPTAPNALDEEEYVDSEPVAQPEFTGHPITDTLEALRSSMEKTADTKPCFNFGLEQDQKGNSVKLGFTIEKVGQVGGKLKLFFFSLGADNTNTRTVANTIEVSFVSRGEFA
jgi:hypothetical protein